MIERISEKHTVLRRTVTTAGRWEFVQDVVGTGELRYNFTDRLASDFRACGRLSTYYGDPANPTMYNYGLGMLMLDDASTIHMVAYPDVKPYISDQHNYLVHNNTRTVTFGLCEADSYDDFVMACRGLYTRQSVPGCVCWLRPDHTMTDDQLKQWVGMRNPKFLICANGKHGADLYGSDIAAEMDRRKSLFPDIRNLAYHDFGFLSTYNDVLAYPNAVHTGDKVGPYYSMIPVNTYADVVADRIARYHNESHADGLYFDLSEGYGPRYTYSQYDGVSGDSKPKGSIALLTEWFRTRMMHAYGFVANGVPWTSASRDVSLIRFAEVPGNDYASLDIHSQLAYIAKPCISEDDSHNLCKQVLANDCLPIEPWDIDFVRLHPAYSILWFPASITE